MANENSNQTKTHKKHKGFQRGMEPGVGFTEAGGPGVLGAQICSVLIWGAGSGGLEPLGLGGGWNGAPCGHPSSAEASLSLPCLL